MGFPKRLGYLPFLTATYKLADVTGAPDFTTRHTVPLNATSSPGEDLLDQSVFHESILYPLQKSLADIKPPLYTIRGE